MAKYTNNGIHYAGKALSMVTNSSSTGKPGYTWVSKWMDKWGIEDVGTFVEYCYYSLTKAKSRYDYHNTRAIVLDEVSNTKFYSQYDGPESAAGVYYDFVNNKQRHHVGRASYWNKIIKRLEKCDLDYDAYGLKPSWRNKIKAKEVWAKVGIGPDGKKYKESK